MPDPNADIRKKEYPTWPKEIREAVDDRLVLVGMAKNQVLASIHLDVKDIQKQMVDATSEKVESWVVWKLYNGWAYLKMPKSQMVTISFREGTVVQVEFHTDTKGAYKPKF